MRRQVFKKFLPCMHWSYFFSGKVRRVFERKRKSPYIFVQAGCSQNCHETIQAAGRFLQPLVHGCTNQDRKAATLKENCLAENVARVRFSGHFPSFTSVKSSLPIAKRDQGKSHPLLHNYLKIGLESGCRNLISIIGRFIRSSARLIL